MGHLIERTAQNLFVTASSVKENGKKRKIDIESRPEFAIIKLTGSSERFPLSWETIYQIAKQHHANNLRLEAEAENAHSSRKRKANQTRS